MGPFAGMAAVLAVTVAVIASLAWYSGRSCPARFPTDRRMSCELHRGHEGAHLTTIGVHARWRDGDELPAVGRRDADDSGPPAAVEASRGFSPDAVCTHRRRRLHADRRVICLDCDEDV